VTDFNARADAAARAIKAQMGLPSTPVPDGSPPQVPPVPGSYAAQIQEQRRAVLEANAMTQNELGRNTISTDLEPAPPSGPGRVAPSEPRPQEPNDVGPDGHHVPFQQHPIYDRFAEVSRERTEFKRGLDAERAEKEALTRKLEAVEAERLHMQQERDQFMEQNLESLAPEERHRFLVRQESQRLKSELREEIRREIVPHVQELAKERRQREIERVAARFPSYDAGRHQPLIDVFQNVNPGCTVEMAFKAIAEPWELQPNGSPVRGQTPPVVVPVPGGSLPKFMPSPTSGDKEEQHLREQAALIRAQASSTNPEERAKAMATATRNVAERLKGRMPKFFQ
jgi:hypothetical protein